MAPQIPVVSPTKFLGVIFDSKLNFKAHIDYIHPLRPGFDPRHGLKWEVRVLPLCHRGPSNQFLGVIFDSKLNFKAHIDYMHQKCEKAMNFLKVVAKMDWGADRSVLLRLYRSFVRSRLEYGCAVFSSARKSYLKKLETIQNQGLRICLGASRTSPMQSLYVEANEQPLYLRFDKLCIQYALKLRSNPDNPAYNVVYNPQFYDFYDKKPSAMV